MDGVDDTLEEHQSHQIRCVGIQYTHCPPLQSHRREPSPSPPYDRWTPGPSLDGC